MSRRERDKGRRGEAEVRERLEHYGFTVRGLEGGGDHFAVGHGVTLHSEVKRCETLRLPAWTRQASREAPSDSIPLVIYRQSRQPWLAVGPEHLLAHRLRKVGMYAGAHYALRDLNGQTWVLISLEALLAVFKLTAPAAAAPEAP